MSTDPPTSSEPRASGGPTLRAGSRAIVNTPSGITLERFVRTADPGDLPDLIARLDGRLGGVFTSGVEYPGRYTRWEIGYEDPLLICQGHGIDLHIRPTGPRGELVLDALADAIAGHPEVSVKQDGTSAILTPRTADDRPVTEEEWSRRPSAFSSLRALLQLLHTDEDQHLAFFGAFAYDLLFHFEPIDRKLDRSSGNVPDFELHLPDRLLVHDRFTQEQVWIEYAFSFAGRSTAELESVPVLRAPGETGPVPPDQPPGTYMRIVDEARLRFARGDLYEVVPSWSFHTRCSSPAQMFERLASSNPAPYGFLMSLTDSHLVGASPEMYVRVTGRTVETCPISGTRPRGRDAMGDAREILDLLSSSKDEAELTMCTDVDRNDKSRVCMPGSVKVIGRRQIELYSRLIHTVDHVVGTLRPDLDPLDAFLTHMWAVTVTGAPKKWATQFIEDHEDAPRRWYGGAVGGLLLNGDINTGLTLRTAEVRGEVATIRAGATLLFDSEPALEEEETRLKASALLRVAAPPEPMPAPPATSVDSQGPDEDLGPRLNVVVVDHEDSFTLNLAAHFRQCGCDVVTVRAGSEGPVLDARHPDLVVLSPGPGRPETFGMAKLIDRLYGDDVAIFGVCLGFQGLVEYEGGRLNQLDTPVHGKVARLTTSAGVLFEADTTVDCGRYHSLYTRSCDVPEALRVTADVDGIAMAIEHRSAPVWGVQFHPESILSAGGPGGIALVRRVVAAVRARTGERMLVQP